jgi:hypothetical protein
MRCRTPRRLAEQNTNPVTGLNLGQECPRKPIGHLVQLTVSYRSLVALCQIDQGDLFGRMVQTLARHVQPIGDIPATRRAQTRYAQID